MRRVRLLAYACTLIASMVNSAAAVVIDVDYTMTSWVDAGVPIAISTGPTGHPPANGQPLIASRINGQTFTTVEGFTLDKIWIKYFDLQPVSDNFTFDIQLHAIASPNANDLANVQTNLFSQPQTYQMIRSAPNNETENYMVFDVEDIALDPGTGYGFFFYLTDAVSSGSGFPFRWFAFPSTTNPYPNGTHHRLDRNPSGSPTLDTVFALQYLIPQASVSMPEPGMALLTAAGLVMMSHRRSRVQV